MGRKKSFVTAEGIIVTAFCTFYTIVGCASVYGAYLVFSALRKYLGY